MADWQGKLREYSEKLKAKEPIVKMTKPKTKKIVHHYYLLKQEYHRWDKVRPVFYRLSCTDRLYANIPANSTNNANKVTCIKCLRVIR